MSPRTPGSCFRVFPTPLYILVLQSDIPDPFLAPKKPPLTFLLWFEGRLEMAVYPPFRDPKKRPKSSKNPLFLATSRDLPRKSDSRPPLFCNFGGVPPRGGGPEIGGYPPRGVRNRVRGGQKVHFLTFFCIFSCFFGFFRLFGGTPPF